VPFVQFPRHRLQKTSNSGKPTKKKACHMLRQAFN
jgi:hypothetical protein